MKKQWKGFLTGFLAAVMMFILCVPTFAKAVGKYIEVSTGINIYMNDTLFLPKDGNGNPIEPFVYNGTTYLPVRAISEALNIPVQWDGETSSVYLGKHSGTTPVAWLGQMDYFDKKDNWNFDVMTKDNLGNEHTHCIDKSSGSTGASLSYKLNGQYSRLTAVYYMEYEYRDWRRDVDSYTLTISGDGKELWRGSVGAGIDPQSIDIDITGVLELKIEIPKTKENPATYPLALGDVALWA